MQQPTVKLCLEVLDTMEAFIKGGQPQPYTTADLQEMRDRGDTILSDGSPDLQTEAMGRAHEVPTELVWPELN